MTFRGWTWDVGSRTDCRCRDCVDCREQPAPATTTQLNHFLRTARMTRRLIPLLFPAVDQPISKLSSQMLLDCPRLVERGQQAAPLPNGALEARILKDDRPLPCPHLHR